MANALLFFTIVCSAHVAFCVVSESDRLTKSLVQPPNKGLRFLRPILVQGLTFFRTRGLHAGNMSAALQLKQSLMHRVQELQKHVECLHQGGDLDFDFARLSALREANRIVNLLATPKEKLSRCIFMVMMFLNMIAFTTLL